MTQALRTPLPHDSRPADSPRESFVPLRRSDVIRLCAREHDGGEEAFHQFSEILLAHIHHDFLRTLEGLKDAYAPFNPDRDTVPVAEDPGADGPADSLGTQFDRVLRAGNYRRVTEDELRQALEQRSLIPLRTAVDLSVYEQYAFYYRGHHRMKSVVRQMFFRKREIEVDAFKRVALLLRFKDESTFRIKTRKSKAEGSNFQPGKIYLYLYKDVPRQDLELLFPNVRVWMTWKDRWLFLLPALAGLGPMIIKILPSIGLLVGVIALYLLGPDMARQFDFDEKKHLAIYPILAAVLSSSMLLGGFAVRQYMNYKNKRLQFLKRVTDTLFFKNLVSNRGVLMTIVDGAEAELGKEMVLAYHHLLKHGPMSKDELDQCVESWVAEKCDRDIDFNVGAALERLSTIGSDSGHCLVCRVGEKWQTFPLSEARQRLDKSWDTIFHYPN